MRITKTKQKEMNITIEPTGKAKVNKGEYSNTYQHTCKGCVNSFKIKNDLVQYVRQTHKHNTCLTCNKILWGDGALNDHTIKCREKKGRQSQKQKPTPKVNTNRNKPTNIYALLMNEGVKNQEEKTSRNQK